jgi:glycosyltransferase involved in cell wall biosynthesis
VRNRELLDEIGAPTFVSTPGLLLDVPYAHFLPVVIDPVPWKTGSKPLRRKRLKVVHIPSNPFVKGTAEILEPLRALNDEGLIEYEQVTGVTHDQMPAIYGDCDIVLDQFRLGDYGVGACEAMASGRLVVSHVSDQARDHIASATGLSLPIVEANIDDIGSVIRDVINRPSFYSAIASRGPRFVRRVHDGSFSREVLEQHFLFPGKPQDIGRGEAT